MIGEPKVRAFHYEVLLGGRWVRETFYAPKRTTADDYAKRWCRRVGATRLRRA